MTGTTSEQRYVFDNAWQQECERLSLMEAGWDPNTIAHLERIGAAAGWRCLEVGGGAGSIVRWLCERAGATGSVLATDLDTRLLMAIDAPNLEVRQHNIVTDDLETGTFDLVHTRLVLEHLPGQQQALTRMKAALKPGGWLIAEEFDHVTMLPDPGSSPAQLALWAKFLAAFQQMSAAHGLDLEYGRRLPGVFRAHGLQDVQIEGRVQMNPGGCPLSRVLALSIAKLSNGLTATGHVTSDDLGALMALLHDPSFVWMSQAMITAWGRKPAG